MAIYVVNGLTGEVVGQAKSYDEAVTIAEKKCVPYTLRVDLAS